MSHHARYILLFLVLSLPLGAQEDAAELDRQIALIVPDLSDHRFGTREAAQRRLREMIENRAQEALPHLRQHWRTSDDPEIRARLFGLANELALPKKGALFGFRFVEGRQIEIDGKNCLTIVVMDLIPQSPALNAGLQEGDLIYGVGNRLLPPGYSLGEILAFFKFLAPGEVQELRIRRDQKDLLVKVRPAEQELTDEERLLLRKELLRSFLEP